MVAVVDEYRKGAQQCGDVVRTKWVVVVDTKWVSRKCTAMSR